VSSDERIKMLCAQLLRTTNPEVIQIVSDELKAAIDAYAASVQQDYPTLEWRSFATETAS
jgi:hypothetical protein